MKNHNRWIVALTLAVSCHAAAARAQNSPRTSRALFGGAGNDPSLVQSLDASLSLTGAYDDQVVRDAESETRTPASPLQRSGFYNGVAGGLTYGWNGKRIQFAASGGSNGRYYQQARRFIMLNHFGSFGVSTQFLRQTRLFVNQSIAYSPAYLNGLVPNVDALSIGAVAGAGSDYSVASQQTYLYDTTASVTRSITARSSVAVLADYRFSAAAPGAGTRDMKAYSLGGRFQHGVSKNAMLRFGYAYREGQYSAGGRPTRVHDIDVGVDYQRALSFSRRTKVNFSTGSTIFDSSPDGFDRARLQYRVVGNAGLHQDIGRTWRANLVYERGIGFSETFRKPVFSDALRVSVDGLVSRRVDFLADGAASFGSVGANAVDNAIRTYQETTRLRFAITARWALYGEYVYYFYNLGRAVDVAAGVQPSLGRQSVRVGLTLWVPLLKR